MKVDEEIKQLGRILNEELHLPVGELDSKASEFFKEVYVNPRRIE